MKDKLFWFALIFAGFYLFNKMQSSPSSQEVNQQTESQSDYSPQTRQEPRDIEPNFGDKNKPLNLPNKNGQSNTSSSGGSSSSSGHNTSSSPSQTSNQKEDISLGKYGSLKLPKKNGQASTTNNSSSQTNRSSDRVRVDLDRSTTAGGGIMREESGSHRLVSGEQVLQVVSSNGVTIYMDTGAFCTLTNCSNSQVYVKANSQLMLTGDGRNNTVYYEQGAEIRNGLEDNMNNQFIELELIQFN